jgi:hypothetical protein
MRPLKMSFVPIALLACLVIACGRGQTPIPPGVQVVHVVATKSEVRLDPSSVHPGDVYLVLDEPMDGSFAFVERKRTAADSPGPLGDDDLERLANGDTEGTAIGSYGVGCDPAQRAEDRGQMGYCGNVWKVAVVAGKYAILGPGWTEQEVEASVDPTADPAGFIAPRSMAVLEVLP